MRLIHTTTLDIEYFAGDHVPKYAILSHTWEDEEVTYHDWANRATGNVSKMKGYQKIVSACELAREDGYSHLWVDTNCIDKSSSTELTEAINSMFAWYAASDVCYAYLSDVATYQPLTGARAMRRSRWFRRGWTLQELLAPRQVVFYAADWSQLGTRTSLTRHISAAAGIALKYLTWTEQGNDAVPPIHTASVAERMAWLARRETTRVEDIAYCALGIFGIHMPLVYGEGQRAFARLQHEILRVSTDHSLFCWSWSDRAPSFSLSHHAGLLAPLPQAFLEAAYVPHHLDATPPSPYAITNAGLSIRLPLLACWSSYIGVLDVDAPGGQAIMGIAMSGSLVTGRFMRRTYPDVPIPTCMGVGGEPPTDMFVPVQAVVDLREKSVGSETVVPETLMVPDKRDARFTCRGGILLSFSPRDAFESITTIPPGCFSAVHSIVEICPPDGPTDQKNQTDPNRGTGTRLVGGTLEGATVVEFGLRGGRTETIVFAISSSSSAAGHVLHPRWHWSRLADAPSQLGIAQSFKRMVATVLPDSVPGSVLHVDSAAMPRISRVDASASNTHISVHIASEGFLTMAGSMLKHVHITIGSPRAYESLRTRLEDGTPGTRSLRDV